MFSKKSDAMVSVREVFQRWVSLHTVDGRNPKKPPGMYKTLIFFGINYQPQLVQDVSHQQYGLHLRSKQVPHPYPNDLRSFYHPKLPKVTRTKGKDSLSNPWYPIVIKLTPPSNMNY